MDNIGSGIQLFILKVFLFFFLFGAMCVGIAWGTTVYLNTIFESSERVIYPSDFKIIKNGKTIDTIYIYEKI